MSENDTSDTDVDMPLLEDEISFPGINNIANVTFRTRPLNYITDLRIGTRRPVPGPEPIVRRATFPINPSVLRPIHPGINISGLGLLMSGLSSYNGILGNSLYEQEAYKRVLSDEGKNQIVYRKYDKEKDEVHKCPILLTEFEDGEEIAELPCKHIFDKESITNWLENQEASCPVCREHLDSKEVKNESTPDNTPMPAPARARVNPIVQIIDDTEERMMQMAIEASLNTS